MVLALILAPFTHFQCKQTPTGAKSMWKWEKQHLHTFTTDRQEQHTNQEYSSRAGPQILVSSSKVEKCYLLWVASGFCVEVEDYKQSKGQFDLIFALMAQLADLLLCPEAGVTYMCTVQ